MSFTCYHSKFLNLNNSFFGCCCKCFPLVITLAKNSYIVNKKYNKTHNPRFHPPVEILPQNFAQKGVTGDPPGILANI
jgi:hypothetical protein